MQNKRLRKLTATSLALSIIFPVSTFANSTASMAEDINNTPVVGRDDVQNKQSEYTTSNVAITESKAETYVTRSSSYSIVIPKTIVLNGSYNGVNSGEYSVSVTGDLTGTQTISVIPQTNLAAINGNGAALDASKVQFYLGQTGKEDIVATIQQSKTSWVWDETLPGQNIIGTGIVTANHMSAGNWNGSFNFNVVIQDNKALVTGTNSYTIDFGCSLNGVSITAIDAAGNRYNGVIQSGGTAVTFSGLMANTFYDIEIVDSTNLFTTNLSSFTTNTVEGSVESVVVPAVSDWEYIITTYEDETVVMLTEYKGTNPDIIVPSTMTIKSTSYPVVFQQSGYTGTTETSVDGNICTIPTGTYGTFINNTNIKSITFESGVRIENNDMSAMFYGCSSLVAVNNIPENITLMDWTFAACSSLEKAPKIPETVTSMYGAFRWDYKLVDISNVVLTDACKTLTVTFAECKSLTSESLLNFYIPNNGVTLYGTFKNCTAITDITGYVLKSNNTDIRALFWGCTNLSGTIIVDCTPSQYMHTFAEISSTLVLNYTSNCTNLTALIDNSGLNNSKANVVAGSLVSIN